MKELSEKIIIKTTPDIQTGKRVMIIYTGGTFGMIKDKGGTLTPFDFNHALEYLPVLKNLHLNISVISFLTPVDSADISPFHWHLIGKIIFEHYDEQDGFVVLHGTDTMAYTSSAISFMLRGLSKPVVFTGAQLPISEPRSDAREHLMAALEIASTYQNEKPTVSEVCLYFNYELHRGCRAKKTQSMYFDAFQSGNYPILAKVGTKIEYMHEVIRPPTKESITLLSRFDAHIATLKLFPGIHETQVSAITKIPGLKGLILETYGSGSAHNTKWLRSILEQTIQKGILILNISQCPTGNVIQGKYKASKWLKDIGVISGMDMTIEAAITKLMLLLGEYGLEEAKKQIGVPWVGELEVPA